MESLRSPPSPWPRRLSDWLERSWAAGWSSKPILDPAAIIDAAARRAGRRPETGRWNDRLNLLCRHLNGEARLNALGQTLAWGQLVRIVASRARAERLLMRHPEIAERRIAAPLIIVGQMRSGTTRMHRLLACDPAFVANRLFEQLDPIPFRRWPRWIDTRPLSAAAAQRGLAWIEPALHAIHPTGAMEVEEEFGLHAFSMWGALFEGQWHVPGFARAMEQVDPADVYDEFAGLLKLLGWVQGAAPGRAPLLKAPQFAQDLDALLSRFPDAQLVVLDRTSADVVASSASLAWHYVRLQSDSVSAGEVGAEWLRKTQLRAQRLAASLDRHPGVARVTLDYADVSRDWRGAIAQVYAMLGRSIEPAVERRMAALMQQGRTRPRHHYSLEQFGLDPRQVAAVLA